MKDTLLFILTQMVDQPDKLSVDEDVRNDKTMFIIHAQKEDIGKIIGRQGRIISALRDLIKLMATKENRYVDITIAEEEV